MAQFHDYYLRLSLMLFCQVNVAPLSIGGALPGSPIAVFRRMVSTFSKNTN